MIFTLRSLLSLVVFAVLLFDARTARAVDPVHLISQYGHRVWQIGDEGLDSPPKSIAQTPDGQIWLGTADGLYQFDGRRFSPWTGGKASSTQPGSIENLFSPREGGLFIGARNGLFKLRNGRLSVLSDLLDQPGPFVQDPNGRVWFGKVGHHSDVSAFCRIGRTALHCHGTRDGIPCWSDFGIAVAGQTRVWVGGYSGICEWTPGKPVRLYPVGGIEAPVTAIVLDPEGSLLASVATGNAAAGLWKFAGNGWHRFRVSGLNARRLNIWKLVYDASGGLWIATHGQGLFRVRDGRVDHFDHRDGLSADTLSDLMIDREGSVWVVTPRGVDQFYDVPITRFSAREGLTKDMVSWVTPAIDGTILAGNGGVIDRIAADGRIDRFASIPGGERSGTLFADDRGRVWSGADASFLMFDRQKRRRSIDRGAKLERGPIQITQDANGNIWAAVQDWRNPPYGWLWRFDRNGHIKRIVSPTKDHYSFFRIASDLEGGLWVYVYKRDLYHWREGGFQRIPQLHQLAAGLILQILPVASREFWLATDHGAAWFKNGQVRILSKLNGLPCDDIYGIAFDKLGDLWLTTQCALVKVAATDLNAWRTNPGEILHPSVFGPSQGYSGDETSRLVRSADGTLWFAGGSDAFEVDPVHVPLRMFDLPMRINRLSADQRQIALGGRVVLPKLTRNVEFDYTALIYRQPGLLDFYYHLLGHDKIWNDAGGRREAFYNDLSPGEYTFEVTACHENHVCSRQDASVTFAIPPTWWQTWLFKISCALIFVAAVGLTVRWRMTIYAKLTQLRFDDRLQERTRVARDLHDTMMQTVLASKLLAESGEIIETVPEARTAFRKLSEWLESAADEGRAAVNSLRPTTIETDDLAGALELAAHECCADQRIDVRLVVRGEIPALHPIVADEIFRVGIEAIRNACVHSGGGSIQILLEYEGELRLSIRDDGRGIENYVLQSGRAGHFGLLGMRERAEAIGAELSIVTSGEGTEVILTVPGSVILPARLMLIKWFDLFRRGKSKPCDVK